MIDTVTLELHDLELHEGVVRILRNVEGGYTKYDGNSKTGTIDREINVYHDSDKQKERIIFKPKMQPSSHYKVIFWINKHKNCITFSFSIPKYFYSHNIAQAVCNANERDFNFTNFNVETQIDLGFRRFHQYIDTFFANEFPTCKIHNSCIELRRLDFCFNQIFKSKGMALEYLELQRNVRKKHMRDESTKSNNYKTAIFYFNDSYSVKIYHKGSEFQKNDRQELERINSYGKMNFDCQYLQEFSDRILRYEITIRPQYMSYLYNANIFRKGSSQFSTWKKMYNKVKNRNKQVERQKFWTELDKRKMYDVLINLYESRVDKTTKLKMFDFLHYLFNKAVPKKELSMNDKYKLLQRFYSEFDTLIHTRRRFFFKLRTTDLMLFQSDNFTNENKFNSFNLVPFDEKLYKLMANKLVEFYKDFNIEQKKSIIEYLKKVDEHNLMIDKHKEFTKGIPSYHKKVSSKIDRVKIGTILAALDKYDLKQLQTIVGFNRTTLYNYQQNLKLIGYSKNTMELHQIDVPDFDFKTYFVETKLNQYKIFQNNFFILNK